MQINARLDLRRCVPLLLIFVVVSAAEGRERRAHTQEVRGRIISDHILVRIPFEREWLGREVILDLERCWRFMNGIMGLPRKVLIIVDWNETRTSVDVGTGSLLIGLKQVGGAGSDLRSLLLHNASREMARLGLLELARENVPGSDAAFLFDGMAEIMAHDFDRSSRSLESAWIFAQFQDRMSPLGLYKQLSVPEQSAVWHDLRASAPGITFLLVCRELYGRERLFKLFESFRRSSLREGLLTVFKATPAEIESSWLKRVREYVPPDDFTATVDAEAPVLLQAHLMPDANVARGAVQLKLVVGDGKNDLSPKGVFVQDEAGAFIGQAHAESERGGNNYIVDLPSRSESPQRQYNLMITAVDGAGNIRRWKKTLALE